MKEQLAGYKQLSQIGAAALIGEFLQLTGDPGQLIQFVEEVNAARGEKPPFGLEELFRVAYRRFSGPEPPSARPSRKPRMKTQDDVWAGILDRLAGQGDSGYFIAAETLLAAFAERAPSLRPDFERIMAEVDRARRTPVRPADSAPPPEEPHGADYIRQQLELQRESSDDDVEMFSRLGEQLGQLVSRQKGMTSRDPQYYAGLLSRISGESGLPLREGTWARIDAERDIEILRRLTVLAAIDNYEATFSHWRKRILETPDSWLLLLASK